VTDRRGHALQRAELSGLDGQEHSAPCLGFAIEEIAHVNIWKNRLAELGLPVGSWLRSRKRMWRWRPSERI
jgi:hypothetical protein